MASFLTEQDKKDFLLLLDGFPNHILEAQTFRSLIQDIHSALDTNDKEKFLIAFERLAKNEQPRLGPKQFPIEEGGIAPPPREDRPAVPQNIVEELRQRVVNISTRAEPKEQPKNAG